MKNGKMIFKSIKKTKQKMGKEQLKNNKAIFVKYDHWWKEKKKITRIWKSNKYKGKKKMNDNKRVKAIKSVKRLWKKENNTKEIIRIYKGIYDI